jgi:dTDP-4-dehydrorhamnose reductase
MLGSALVSVLGRNGAVELYATGRKAQIMPSCGVKEWLRFHAGEDFPPLLELAHGDWIVNAAGAIPQRHPEETDELGMVRVNALLPYELAEVCDRTGARMVHVTTDCVYSGRTPPGRTVLNRYKEHDTHNNHRLYGRTKSMGEVLNNKRVLNLRCSIVGPEPFGRADSLLGWFLGSAVGEAAVIGYADHYWNGVTTLALSKVIEGLVLYDQEISLPSLHHLVPKGAVSKAELLGLFNEHFAAGAKIDPASLGGVDRTLGTSHPGLNNRLWALAGYEDPPTIEEMVQELARWVGAGNYPFKKEASA